MTVNKKYQKRDTIPIDNVCKIVYIIHIETIKQVR